MDIEQACAGFWHDAAAAPNEFWHALHGQAVIYRALTEHEKTQAYPEALSVCATPVVGVDQ
ncbi:hypothetical protein [Streptomyces sp. NBC_00690]|uniref:hypothetical protein n=1 Tax=Streptomyces sp. NBC_00690 TaxID=2975808 RepID=UPI002E2A3072|nr:hypothetical protein [Streptomyces sp. NBC_00690]